MRYRDDDDSYSRREAQLDCTHDFVSLYHRFLSPFDSGRRCRHCGLVVDEEWEDPDNPDDDEDEEEDEEDFDDEIEDDEEEL